MQGTELLHLIWQGAVAPAKISGSTRLERFLAALMPVKFIHLEVEERMFRTRVLLDEIEMMPALSLGDVLVEELDIDVPTGALVVITPASALRWGIGDSELSYQAGVVVGEALIEVAQRGLFPLNRETDALFLMACSYHWMADSAEFRRLGLVTDRFRAGLAAAVGTHWSTLRTGRTEPEAVFLTPDALVGPAVSRYLCALDKGFSALDPTRAKATLMLFAGGGLEYDTWVRRIESAVARRFGIGSPAFPYRNEKQI